MKKKKIIIFDYDGVLMDSLNAGFKVYNDLSKKYGLKKLKTKKEFENLFNNNFFETLKQKGVTEKGIHKYINDARIELESRSKEMRFFKGVLEMIKELSKEHKLIIVTSNITEVVEKKLKSKKIKGFSEVLGSDIEKSKTKKILQIKLKNPNSSLFYIGDTSGDIKEAKNANAKTIGVTWGYQTKNNLKKVNPDYIVNSVKELIEIFED